MQNVNNTSMYEQSEKELAGAIRVWILRLLVELDGNSKFLNNYGYEEYSVSNFLGLFHSDDEPYNISLARKQIEAQHKKSKNISSALPRTTITARNIKALSQCLGLGKVDSMLLHFAVICKSSMVLSDAISLITNIKPTLVPRIFATCLRLNIQEVNQALRVNSSLAKTGLLIINQERSWGFSSAVNLIDGMVESLEIDGKKPVDLFNSIIVESSEPSLAIEDYQHLEEEVTLLHQYIKSSLKARKKGVNVLLYGPPGTGKTELAKLVAKLANAKLYEIGYEGSDGLSLSASDRFRAYGSAQSLFSNLKNHLILFDEVEDVFNKDSPSVNGDKTRNNKAWLNNQLEENPIPAFWITNNQSNIDDAFLRRFDVILKVGTPSTEVRKKVVNHFFDDMCLSEETKGNLIESKNLSPATIERASKVISTIGRKCQKLNIDSTVRILVGNTLKAMQYPELPNKKNGVEEIFEYDLDVLNADCDMKSVAQEVVKHGGARICVYGPPGTGKSAFGRYIAHASERPLLVRKASDILSPYIGEAEQNMAEMFKEAKVKKAVLVLDEADTYLQDRRNLKRSWEISGVNEMLTQIESYDGVFICSTNLMDSMDQAVLRRFDLKIRFNALQAKQSERLFNLAAAKLGIMVIPEDLSQLKTMMNLTPGDFANVIRQSRFRPVLDQADFLKRLMAESDLKKGSTSRTIGFIS